MTASKTGPLRLAAVAYGKHADDHTGPSVLALPDLAEYLVVVDTDVAGATDRVREFATEGRARALERGYDVSAEAAERFSQIPVIGSLDDVLTDPSIDGVVITTHTATHADYARRALAAGKHVHLAKPLGWQMRQVEEICALADRKGLAFQGGYQWAAYAHKVREAVRAGNYGPFRGARGQLNRRNGIPGGSFHENPDTGGAILDCAGHLFCVPVAAADYRPVEITATNSYACGLRSEDGAKGTMVDQNGAVFEWETYWVADEPLEQRFRVELTFERGLLDLWLPGWDPRRAPYRSIARWWDGDGWTRLEEEPMSESECVSALMSNWLGVALGREEQLFPPTLSLTTERMVHGARKAATTGRAATITYP